MITRKSIVGFGILVLVALSTARLALGQDSGSVVKARGLASVEYVRPGDRFKVAVVLEIASGYHINAHVPTEEFLKGTEVRFEPVAGLRFGESKYSPPKMGRFEFSPDKDLAVHEGTVYITTDVEADSSIKAGAYVIPATVTVQSCNETQCLFPSTLKIEVPVKVEAASQYSQAANAEVFKKAEEIGYADAPAGLVEYRGSGQGGQASNAISDLISSRGLFFALGFIFLSGLALNATPCVYPIIPITIGFFANQGNQGGSPRLSRTFSMASMYVLGMAITYSILGVIASMSEGLFGAALQNPLVLIALALVMVGLALSMFGVYEFRMPEFLNRFATQSTQSTSGLIGALVMGLTMGIVAAPCIGPFVLALLVHVGTKGDPLYGFMMFFVLALGLGLPYLILGTFSGAIKSLPRSGLWMVTVRKIFGLMLIGMALYFLMPLMGRSASYIFIAFFFLSALYLIFWESGRTKPKQFAWILRGLGIAAAIVGVIIAIPKETGAGITWHPYSEQALAQAQREGRGVIIDTFADWCIPCKELDQLTFTDSDVRREAERFLTLKLDLTTNDPDSEAGRARRRFNILGVPTVIFLDPKGQEQSNLRLGGFEKPAAFLSRMKQVSNSPASGPVDQVVAKNSADASAPVTDAAKGVSMDPAPAVSLKLLEGGNLDLERLRGKVVLIDFWATWCVPCISEIPIFNDFARQYKESGLELVAISMDEEGAAVVKPFLKKHPMNYRQVIGDGKVSEAFNLGDSSLPVAFLIDKQGRIRFKHVGVTPRATFESELKQLLAE
ncbi:MAG TPA: cytochrome c biogenesis protein CcdA [Blastocatellia bacterium]|nr:cytochrome c biogenesis protein CcdA [Blastocatellia bacterium]